MNGLEKVLIVNKKSICKECKGLTEYLYSGVYRCTVCGKEELDNFGKVKAFIEANGPSSAYIISEGTGVSMQEIDLFLRTGRVEIPDGSDIFIKCERCACDIRYGRFCPECVRELANGIKRAFLVEDIGERPKKYDGKMRFLNRDNR